MALDDSAMLRGAFGDDVIDHYVHAARWEQAEYDRAVTDWEIARGFEPRLQRRSVKVSLVDRDTVEDFSVRIRIEGVLHVEPYTEMVSFDTDIHFDTGEFDVRSEA